jgi:hypothetical protein
MQKIMRKNICLLMALLLKLVFCYSIVCAQNSNSRISGNSNKIDLSGAWRFQTDSLDKGVKEQWYNKKLGDQINLPGSMTTNGKGNDIALNTPWTGQIVDSSWFIKPQYAKYREPGNIKVPFWLQPVKYYKGAAWYQKTVTIPVTWKSKHLELFIERSHWETTVWVDDKQFGMVNSLGTPHVFDLSQGLPPGVHQITVRVDNRVKDFNVGQNSHSISDHTQSNWNGMVGKLFITARPRLFIEDVQLFPDVNKKQVTAQIKINNETGAFNQAEIQLLATSGNANAEQLRPLVKSVTLQKDNNTLEVVYPMGNHPLLWDEFHPHLYSFKLQIRGGNETDERVITFGMRKFAAQGTQFTINGRLTFLRGTLECAIFPKTRYPPTDTASWMHIFQVARSYGLNHMRFHSWCPPEAAFDAADRCGFYLQVECSSWANQGATVGDGKPVDQYIYDESERIVKVNGNHPSFCMLAYGNEPAGKNHTKYLTDFVNYWKKKDPRRLYTTAAGWPVVPENDYNSTPSPRIQAWGQGLKSIINGQSPKSNYDWRDIISKWQHPTVSHEIGQWCVYPDFKEIKKYTGVLQAKNFEIFQEQLQNNGMGHLADSFLLASGKLQALCYKADIEAALRTPGFGGFQLLDLHDFPGQGTALVGVLNPFWEDKGYITAKEYSRFCNSVVPLARFSKMVWLNNEQLIVPVEIANFGETAMKNTVINWAIKNEKGEVLYKGIINAPNIEIGNGMKAGEIRTSLSNIEDAGKVTFSVQVGKYENSWEIFVYPHSLPQVNEDHVKQQIDQEAIQQLNDGGKVLLTLKKNSLAADKGGDIKIGFSSIFWNTAWTNGQPPTTLGILCDPHHAALNDFPTQYHSNYQWWDAITHSNTILLDSVATGLKPIVRVIDDWVTANSLGLIFECKVGRGQLLVSGIDLTDDIENRPEARQLMYSLKKYMAGNKFHPEINVDINRINGLFKNND